MKERSCDTKVHLKYAATYPSISFIWPAACVNFKHNTPRNNTQNETNSNRYDLELKAFLVFLCYLLSPPGAGTRTSNHLNSCGVKKNLLPHFLILKCFFIHCRSCLILSVERKSPAQVFHLCHLVRPLLKTVCVGISFRC